MFLVKTTDIQRSRMYYHLRDETHIGFCNQYWGKVEELSLMMF